MYSVREFVRLMLTLKSNINVMKLLQLFLLAGLIFLAQNGIGQDVIDRSKERATNKTENRVDTRIDQGIDKGLDSIEGLFKKKNKKDSSEQESVLEQEDSTDKSESAESTSNQNESGSGGFNMQGMFKPAKWESRYSFDLKVNYIMTTTNKKGKVDEVNMDMLYDKMAMAMKIESKKEGEEPVLMIFDYDNKSMITLTEDKGKKSGMAIAMSEEQIAAIEEEVDEHSADAKIVKTGRSKSILGYTCEEYTFTDEDTEGSAWLTQEISYNSDGFMGMMNVGDKRRNLGFENYPQGFLMLTDSKDLKSGELSHLEVLKVDKNANETLDLSPYEVMDPMQMMQQK